MVGQCFVGDGSCHMSHDELRCASGGLHLFTICDAADAGCCLHQCHAYDQLHHRDANDLQHLGCKRWSVKQLGPKLNAEQSTWSARALETAACKKDPRTYSRYQ